MERSSCQPPFYLYWYINLVQPQAMKTTILEAGEDEDLVSDAYNNVNEDGDAPSGLSATMANDEDDNLVNDDR